MTSEISNETKKQIFDLIATPGIQIEEIVKEVNLDYETILNVLCEEYLKHDLNFGRRLCCRF
ncbi:MAG: hypothetical protein ACFE9I_08530 [Candidatus Hermodarchaeota archaeon]